jgi:beta-glucanase (GH16 family)
MRKTSNVFIAGICASLAFVSVLSSCSKSAFNGNGPVIPVTPPTDTTKKTTDTTTYKLLWSDEFNGTSVDNTKWTMETGNLGVNQEEEYYQASNATVNGGNLVISAKQENVGGFFYTSARMNTANKFSVTYGKIEARIKLPVGTGLWPAFWMLGTDINTGTAWPGCGEIDIMEHIDTDSLIYGTIHWSNNGSQADYGLNLASAPSEYHIYSVVWDANAITWYVDNTVYCTANIANGINGTTSFHKPFFIILNLAVGGSWPGLTVDSNKLPANMYVDYVRVYQAN